MEDTASNNNKEEQDIFAASDVAHRPVPDRAAKEDTAATAGTAAKVDMRELR